VETVNAPPRLYDPAQSKIAVTVAGFNAPKATRTVTLLLFAAVAWYVARYGRVLQETGSLSETLRTIVYPWVYVVAAGGAGLALALLIDFLRSAGQLLALRRRRS